MKVLHLVSSGGLFGAERVILTLAGSRCGFESVVGALHNRHNPHLEIIGEADRLGLPKAVFDSGGRFDGGAVSRVRHFLRDNGIDVIHTHNYKSDIIGFFAAKGAGKKWVATNHVWHSTDQKLRLYERMDAFALKFADKVVAVSDEIKRDLLSKGFTDNGVWVIHNGIDVSEFQQSFPVERLRGEWGWTMENIVFSIIGRLAPEKGHEIFLKAAVEVLRDFKGARFLIVGDGPLRETLEARVQDLGLSGAVAFTGIRKDMPAVYALSDVLVNSSSIEGLPMTILEAMASKLAIIATKVGAVPQVIRDQANGLLIEPGDPAVLAGAMRELAGQGETRRRLAQHAFEDVCARFSARHMAEQYQRVYQEVLG
ncbi:MAG: glycosyltransferase family 4 protein [Candidatus Omnitrophota bacterium]|nr:glycosyltransferase family 4 protein [Candidatus Omnitrophota bacterium]MDZ4241680.1 glycosyltransferase family 4 protein [Candidatus Omnitrophota bacterium]